MTHTKEPWSIDPKYGDIVSGPHNVCIVHVMTSDDKKRAVSCVNALAGLNPDAVTDVVEAAESVLPYLETMLVDGDPDEESVGWEWEGEPGGRTRPIDFTMGQIRALRTALARIRGEG